MTEFKKTLQQGTPGAAAQPGSAPRSPVQPQPGVQVGYPVSMPGSAPGSNPLEPLRGRVIAPPGPAAAARASLPSAPGVPSSDASPPSSDAYVPPPPGNDELNRTRPPPGHRTPSATRQAPNFGPPLPENAPGWMLRARRMSLALEEAIRAGQPPPPMEACIERAWAAWELDGSADKQIARIARLVDKAHVAIRETPAQKLETAYNECAQVLWAGLPRHVKARQDFAQILLVVRDLRSEADSWAAVVDATSRILGWVQAARAHAAHSVRVAILSEK